MENLTDPKIKEGMDRLKLLLKTFAADYIMKQEKTEELETLNKSLKKQEGKLIEIIRECGLESFKCEHGTISVWEKATFATPKEAADRSAFFDYLREKNVFDDMVSVNYNTLNAWAEKEYESAKEKGDLTFAIPGLGAPTVTPMLSKTKLAP